MSCTGIFKQHLQTSLNLHADSKRENAVHKGYRQSAISIQQYSHHNVTTQSHSFTRPKPHFGSTFIAQFGLSVVYMNINACMGRASAVHRSSIHPNTCQEEKIIGCTSHLCTLQTMLFVGIPFKGCRTVNMALYCKSRVVCHRIDLRLRFAT